MMWFLIACAVFGLIMGITSPTRSEQQFYDRNENEYDCGYDGGYEEE